MPSSHEEYPVKRTRFALSPSGTCRPQPDDASPTAQFVHAPIAASPSPSRPASSVNPSPPGKRKFLDMESGLSDAHRSPDACAPAACPPSSPSSSSSAADDVGEGSSRLPTPRFTALTESLRPGSSVGTDEYLRLTLQTLRELGLNRAVSALEAESGVQEEPLMVALFRTLVLTGQWRRAKRVLKEVLTEYCRGQQPAPPLPSLNHEHDSAPATSPRSPLRSTSTVTNAHIDTSPKSPDASSSLPQDEFAAAMRDPSKGWTYIKQLIYQQRYLELIEAGDRTQALYVLRTYITPLLGSKYEQVRWWSSLILCSTPEELECKVYSWEGAGLESRQRLLKQIEDTLAPAIMLPSHRMNTLLEQALDYQRHGASESPPPFSKNGRVLSLCVDGDKPQQQLPTCCLQVLHTAQVGDWSGETWTVSFSPDGRWLACGGSGRKVALYLLSDVRYCFIGHLGLYNAPVSSLAWSPDGQRLVVGCDPDMYLYELSNDLEFSGKALTPSHDFTVSAIAWLPSGKGFVTGGQDHKVMFWDRDGRHLTNWFISPFRVLGLDVSPDGTRLVVASFSHTVPNDSFPVQVRDTAQRSNIFPCPLLPSGLPLLEQARENTRRAVSPSDPGSDLDDAILTLLEERDHGVDYGQGRAPRPEQWSSSWSNTRTGYLSTAPPKVPGTSNKYENQPYALHVFDLTRNAEKERLFLQEEVHTVRFTSDSRYILTSHRDNAARLWDLCPPGPMLSLSAAALYQGHACSHHQLTGCFGGPEEQYVIMGSQDSRAHIYHRSSGRHLGASWAIGRVLLIVLRATLPSPTCSQLRVMMAQ